MAEYKYGGKAEKKIGAAFKEHNILANGFLEINHQQAGAGFSAVGKISIERKVLAKLEDVRIAQDTACLKANSLAIGSLINSGAKTREYHLFTSKKFQTGNHSAFHTTCLSQQPQF